jgi:hypothetical protein
MKIKTNLIKPINFFSKSLVFTFCNKKWSLYNNNFNNYKYIYLYQTYLNFINNKINFTFNLKTNYKIKKKIDKVKLSVFKTYTNFCLL